MRAQFALAFPMVAVGLISCSNTHDGSPVAAPVSGSTHAPQGRLAPPAQNPSPGHSKVTFDPCTDINDDLLREFQLDAASRKRADSLGDVNIFFGCEIEGPDKLLTFLAGNESYEDQLKRDTMSRPATRPNNPAQQIFVNGRPAFMGVNLVDAESCTVAMRVNFGVVIVDGGFLLSADEVNRRGLDVCQENLRVATRIEPLLPKG